MSNKKVIALAGSNSSTSINKRLVKFAASLLENASVEVLDLNDFDLPIYGVDLEKSSGIPENALRFKEFVNNSDGIMISLAEHNGAYAAVFKNIFDWISRTPGKAWAEKPMLLLATSPGGRGGSSVLDIAAKRFPYNGGQVIETFSLPLFNEKFDDNNGVTDEVKSKELKKKVELFESAL